MKQANNYYEREQSGKSKTPEYSIYKSMINSTFGLMVTRMALDKVTYKNDEWEVSELALDYSEEVAKQVLLPQWGIYVAAHGRHELLKTVYAIEKVLPKSVAYCDTDSIKTEFNECIKEVIRKYNEEIARQIKAKESTAYIILEKFCKNCVNKGGCKFYELYR